MKNVDPALSDFFQKLVVAGALLRAVTAKQPHIVTRRIKQPKRISRGKAEIVEGGMNRAISVPRQEITVVAECELDHSVSSWAAKTSSFARKVTGTCALTNPKAN